MSLTNKLRQAAEPIWSAILRHPFVSELYKGVLSMDKFRYYLLQDFNYLVGFVKALAAAAVKAPYLDGMRLAVELAHGELTTELASYEVMLAELGLSLKDAQAARPNPTNVAYMNFLSTTCLLGTYGQCLAALLPCFWTYQEIAETHAAELEGNPVPIYKKWASTYLSPEYKALVRELRATLDGLGEDFEALKGPFLTASAYELMFWDAAYRGETWPA